MPRVMRLGAAKKAFRSIFNLRHELYEFHYTIVKKVNKTKSFIIFN